LISAFALIASWIAEIAVITSPAILSIAAFALCSFSCPSPIVLVQSRTTSLHSISCGVAHMASLASPVVLSVAAFAYNVVVYISFTISAIPGHQ
jgi:hypothetical protein